MGKSPACRFLSCCWATQSAAWPAILGCRHRHRIIASALQHVEVSSLMLKFPLSTLRPSVPSNNLEAVGIIARCDAIVATAPQLSYCSYKAGHQITRRRFQISRNSAGVLGVAPKIGCNMVNFRNGYISGYAETMTFQIAFAWSKVGCAKETCSSSKLA